MVAMETPLHNDKYRLITFTSFIALGVFVLLDEDHTHKISKGGSLELFIQMYYVTVLVYRCTFLCRSLMSKRFYGQHNLMYGCSFHLKNKSKYKSWIQNQTIHSSGTNRYLFTELKNTAFKWILLNRRVKLEEFQIRFWFQCTTISNVFALYI